MTKVCGRCVMDTTDPDIAFDARGVCNHCRTYDENVRARVFSGDEGRRRLTALVEEIRTQGKGREYDCVIGVSGGVDSTFVAWKARELGLRPLAVHLDNGWDSELAVKNIERTLKTLAIDLQTHVMDWPEFRDLQLSFLKASTPDSEIPSDHAIVALLFRKAREAGVAHILSGVNQRTESHLPRAWSRGHQDWKYIRSVHAQFGSRPLTTFPHQGMLQLIRDRSAIRWVDLLNLVDYSRKDAMRILEEKLGWTYYGGKHHESIYTRFYQGVLLPRKFGFDKRKCHLSSLICSGETTRDAAQAELAKEPYAPELQAQDREYVIKKLALTPEEFDRIMALPPRRFEDYPSYDRGWLYPALRAVYRAFGG
ncbi:MAG: N-acetyl sugar amidotransferase [Planctomycetes bacterium]|nr:N-acetyl sugar amidotransferase [Planctomycetota bacterium]